VGTTQRPQCSWFTLFLFAIFLLLAIPSIPERSGMRHPVGGEARRIPSEVEILRAFEKAAEGSPFFKAVSSAFALVVSLGILIDIRFVWRRIRKGAPWSLFGSAVGWGFADVAKVIVVFFMAFFSLGALYPLCGYCHGGASDISFTVMVQFLAEFAALCVLFQCVSARWRGALGRLGLASGNVLSHVGAGVMGYVGFLPVLLLLTSFTEEAARRVGIRLEPQEQIGFFFADLSFPSLVFLVVFVAVVGPVFEEIFFRGFAYQAFRRRWSRWPSILVTALLFSALHASLAAFLPIMGLGVLLACVFESSGSLVPSIVIHVCQNSIAVVGALLVRSLSL
jgi:hypothetical protein